MTLSKEHRMMSHHIVHPDELAGVASTMLSTFPEARIFAFYGAMGVGKTTMIQVICQLLGVTDMVNSPSFGIVNHYQANSGNNLYHFDFYRIKSLEEVYDIGYEEYFFSGSYCFIEWAERVEPLLPLDCVKVFMNEEQGGRLIRF